MTPKEMVVFLGDLHLPTSEARRQYRANKAAGGCPICGTKEKTTTYCGPCYELIKEAQEMATRAGICRYCFAAKVAPAKKGYRGKVTQCQECREAATQRKLNARFSKVVEVGL